MQITIARVEFESLIIACANHRINYVAHEQIVDHVYSQLNEREFSICEFITTTFDVVDDLRAMNYYIDAMNSMR